MITTLGIYALKYIFKKHLQFSGSQPFFLKTDMETLISKPFTENFPCFFLMQLSTLFVFQL